MSELVNAESDGVYDTASLNDWQTSVQSGDAKESQEGQERLKGLAVRFAERESGIMNAVGQELGLCDREDTRGRRFSIEKGRNEMRGDLLCTADGILYKLRHMSERRRVRVVLHLDRCAGRFERFFSKLIG